MLLAVDKIASYPIHLECPPLEGKTHLGFVHVVLDGVDFEFGETVCELALGVGGGGTSIGQLIPLGGGIRGCLVSNHGK